MITDSLATALESCHGMLKNGITGNNRPVSVKISLLFEGRDDQHASVSAAKSAGWLFFRCK
jgi:hypothetical protein